MQASKAKYAKRFLILNLLAFGAILLWQAYSLKDKENYINYYEKCMDLVNKNGLIIIDNVLWHGEVADEKNNNKFTINIREFNKFVSEDKRVEQIIIPLGDGMTVCIVL